MSTELSVKRAVLFGSWASGRSTAFSDIDILVVYAGPLRADAYHVVRRHIALRGLEPHVYTEQEAADLSETLDLMVRGGVSLML